MTDLSSLQEFLSVLLSSVMRRYLEEKMAQSNRGSRNLILDDQKRQ